MRNAQEVIEQDTAVGVDTLIIKVHIIWILFISSQSAFLHFAELLKHWNKENLDICIGALLMLDFSDNPHLCSIENYLSTDRRDL